MFRAREAPTMAPRSVELARIVELAPARFGLFQGETARAYRSSATELAELSRGLGIAELHGASRELRRELARLERARARALARFARDSALGLALLTPTAGGPLPPTKGET